MCQTNVSYRGVATSMIAWHKKPRHDLIVVLHLKSCGAAEKSLHDCLRRAIIEVATPRLKFCSSAGTRFYKILQDFKNYL